MIPMATAGFDGGRGQRPRSVGSLQKLGNTRKQIVPWKCPRERDCKHLAFSPGRPFCYFWLQNCKVINLYCLTPSGL